MLLGISRDYEINGLSFSENQVIELPYPDLEQGRYRLDVIVQDIDLGESSESLNFFVMNKAKAVKAVFMQAEIITIGDEILIGQIVDTNSTWIANQLELVGVRVRQIFYFG